MGIDMKSKRLKLKSRYGRLKIQRINQMVRPVQRDINKDVLICWFKYGDKQSILDSAHAVGATAAEIGLLKHDIENQ